MADTSPTTGGWTLRPPRPRSIVELISAGTLDAELAGMLWPLVEGRVPLVVAGPAGTEAAALLDTLLAFVAPGVRVVTLSGRDETFDWLPQATELGWTRPDHPRAAGEPVRRTEPVRPTETVLRIAGPVGESDAPAWGPETRIAVRAASIGFGLAGAIDAGSLDDVFATLRATPVRLDDDELSHLGLVLVLRAEKPGIRVSAAHYVRPVARDGHGHVQRLGPAVLSTWEGATDAFEHFGWGVIPELARRIGVRAGDFEIDVERRRAWLADLAGAGTIEPDAVAAAIARYREGALGLASASRPAKN